MEAIPNPNQDTLITVCLTNSDVGIQNGTTIRFRKKQVEIKRGLIDTSNIDKNYGLNSLIISILKNDR